MYLANFKAAHRNISLFQRAHSENGCFISNVIIRAKRHYLNNLDNFTAFIIHLESGKKTDIESTSNTTPVLQGVASETSQKVNEVQQTHCELKDKLSQPLCSRHSDILQEKATFIQCELSAINLSSDSTQSFSYQV